MKNAKHLLRLFLITLTVSSAFSCSSLSAGRKCPCLDAVVPVRPDSPICIANANGSAECFGPAGSVTVPVVNYVCQNPEDNQTQEEWIRQILDILK